MTAGGRAFVVFGSNNTSATFYLRSLNGTNGFVVLPPVSGENFGAGVELLKDINGDGFDDFIVGSPFSDHEEINSGKSYVVFGKESGFGTSYSPVPDGREGFVINGAERGDVTGQILSSAGDINADGFNDILMGVGTAKGYGGVVYTVFGSNSFEAEVNLGNLSEEVGFTILSSSNEPFGNSFDLAGDFNDDGIDDIIVGAASARGAFPDLIDAGGEAYMVFGDANIEDFRDIDLTDGANGFQINGVEKQTWFGRSVSSAGDFNGDGTPDIIVGNPGSDQYGVIALYGVVDPERNHPPTVNQSIADQELDKGFGVFDIDLSNVFFDEDGDELALSVSLSIEGIVDLNIESQLLHIVEIEVGNTTVTVTADDTRGGIVSCSFDISVIENSSPVVLNPIPDIELEENFESESIDLLEVFSDQGNDTLTFTVSSADINVISVQESEGVLLLEEEGLGVSTVSITADDGNGGTVLEEFIVTVSEKPNVIPILMDPLPDTEESEGFESSLITVSDVFFDEDGDNLEYEATSSETEVVSVLVTGDILTFTEFSVGSSLITLTAFDGEGASVSDEFYFTIKNSAPIVLNSMPDLFEYEGFGSFGIEVEPVFYDFGKLEYRAFSSNESVVSVSIDEAVLNLTEVGNGLSIISITAMDSYGSSITEEFEFTITETNKAPVIESIEDQKITVFESIELEIVASDPNGDDLSFDVVIKDEQVVSLEFYDQIITLNALSPGETNIAITVSDDDLSVSTDFDVLVESILSLDDEKGIIYPTVTSGRVSFEMSDEEIVSVKIYNTTGQLIDKIALGGKTTIDLSYLQQGLYYIESSFGNNSSITTRLIKVN